MSMSRVIWVSSVKILDDIDLVVPPGAPGRYELIRPAVYAWLKEQRENPEFRSLLVTQYMEDNLSYESLSLILGKEQARDARRSRMCADRGDIKALSYASPPLWPPGRW